MVDTCCTHNCDQGRKCPERTANIIEFQKRGELHRYFAPGVIEEYREPITVGERVLLVAVLGLSAFCAVALIGFAYESLTGADWGAVAQLVGVVK